MTASIVLMLGSILGCSPSGEVSADAKNSASVSANTVIDTTHFSEAGEQSPFTEGCHALAPEELVRLQELKQHTPYTVLVPTCIPAGYKLDFSSVVRQPPIASESDASKPDYEKKPSYEYKFTNGNYKLEFIGNVNGDPGVAFSDKVELRGHQAIVFFGNQSTNRRAASFKESDYFRLLWDEGRDLISPSDRYGVYYLYGMLTWEKMRWIVNGMVSIDDAVPESDGACNIRGYDWSALLGTKPNNDHIEKVLYSDLDGDGAEEALVQRRIEGSGGYFNVYIFDCSENGLVKVKEWLDMRRGDVTLGDKPGTFVIKAGIFESNDRNCCPSNFDIATFSWYGENKEYVITSDQIVHNPEDQTP